MTDKNITYAVDDEGIATITWDMPGRSMNVLSEASLSEYAEAAHQAIADDQVKGVIVTSGKRDFIAGADLDMLFNWKGSQAILDGMSAFNAVFRQIETSGKPFAAAIRGMCLGGGYEIALACHYRVAAQDPRSRIGLPEALVGLMPGGGGTQRLPRLIGIQPALPVAPAPDLLHQGSSPLGDPVLQVVRQLCLVEQAAHDPGLVDPMVGADPPPQLVGLGQGLGEDHHGAGPRLSENGGAATVPRSISIPQLKGHHTYLWVQCCLDPKISMVSL